MPVWNRDRRLMAMIMGAFAQRIQSFDFSNPQRFIAGVLDGETV
ncbi:hypothetical protein [Mycolicibacterium komossense]|nr:hypothetical protein [Mycolicibacterium komossense]